MGESDNVMTAPLPLLGKLPYRHDDRTLVLHRYLSSAAIPLAPPVLAAPVVGDWGMMLNDKVGDCAIVAPAHIEMTWTYDAGSEFTPTDAQVQAEYSAVSGYDPTTGANDNGCVILDVLNRWQSAGLFGHKCGPYARVDTQDAALLRAGIALFGALDFGFALPVEVQGAADWSDLSGTPGSWGGHSVPGVGYDADGVWVVTWGKLVHATWAFIAKYSDESWAVISQDFLNAAGETPQGFNIAQLQADLQAIQGTPAPAPKPKPPHKRRCRFCFWRR